MAGTLRWTVLIPMKALPAAKSRLAQTLPPHQHVEVVEAIRADTVAATRASHLVNRVVLVVDRPSDLAGGDLVLVQTAPGLNPGLAEAAEIVARRWPTDGIAALVGDLPALVAADLDAALAAASGHPRSFVPDSAGTGTTLLAVTPGTALEPAYGTGSAARHGAIAEALAAGASLRADVDTADDLTQARVLGVGSRTTAVLASFDPQRDEPSTPPR